MYKKEKRNLLVTSATTGPIVVEDVVYEDIDGPRGGRISLKDMTFGCLTFQRSLGLVQSEALLIREGHSNSNLGEVNRRKTNQISKSKKKAGQRKSSSSAPLVDESRNLPKVDHQYLASSYHAGIISGFVLVSSHLNKIAASGKTAKTIVIGLGAGLLPMFLRACLPCLDIEVHVADGIEFVQKVANIESSTSDGIKNENDNSAPKEKLPSSNRNSAHHVQGKEITKIDMLIIDVDSSDSSSGMSCPHPDFLKESFLISVKESLSQGGLFIINLVSRSPAIRDTIVAKIKGVSKIDLPVDVPKYDSGRVWVIITPNGY